MPQTVSYSPAVPKATLWSASLLIITSSPPLPIQVLVALLWVHFEITKTSTLNITIAAVTSSLIYAPALANSPILSIISSSINVLSFIQPPLIYDAICDGNLQSPLSSFLPLLLFFSLSFKLTSSLPSDL